MSSTITGTTVSTGVTIATTGTTSGTYGSPLTIASNGGVVVSSGNAVYSSMLNPTLVNDGRVAATGGGYGVSMTDGGVVSNALTSSYIGGGYGIYIKGAAGSVTNAGTILGTAGTGVALDHGGSVGNTGTGALIQGTFGGVYIGGTVGTVTNTGTILSAAGNGVALYNGGSVGNTATAALVRASNDAVYVKGTIGTVTNDGSIATTGSSNAYGVFLAAGGIVTNVSGASISGQTQVRVDFAAGTVTNTGTMSGTHGISLGAGGYVHNQTGGLIEEALSGVLVSGTTGTVTNAGTIEATATNGIGIDLVGGGTVIDSGTISGGSGTAIEFGVTSGNLLALEHGYSLSGAVTVAGTANTLELLGTAGAVTVGLASHSLSTFGTVTFGAASGNNETLTITNASGTVANTIAGFTTSHDIIDLTGLAGGTISGGTINGSHQLVVSNGTGTVTLQLDPSGNYSGIVWQTGTDGGSGTDITPACFVRGTRILTEAGEAAVEDLAIGDRVVTMSGMARPIKWIGRRSYDRRFIAGNRGVLPIRITAGALADGVPSRELWVSPQHALYLDGALVPAEHLVNNLTIVQEEHVERVEYFHIELDSHDVIFAEGVAAESYVECDNRGVFHNAGEFALLYPEAEPACWTFCAPRLEAGTDEAVAIRARIARRAGQPEGPAADRMTAAQARDLRPADGRVAGCVLPTGWRWWSKAGLSCEVVGRGRQDGIAYVDVRVFGTPKATTHANQILLTGSSEIPVRHGECWQAGAHVGLSGGSLHNVQAVEIAANLNAAEGGYSSWFGATFVTPLGGAATRRRGGRRFVQRHFARSGTITDRAAAYLQPLLQIATIEGAAVDLTLRIGHPSATRLAPTELPEQRRTAA